MKKIVVVSLLTAGLAVFALSGRNRSSRRAAAVGGSSLASAVSGQHASTPGLPSQASAKPARKAKAGKQNAMAVDKEGMPLALSQHLKNLARTIPGNGGESPNGPGGAAAEAFLHRAYPEADIPAERYWNARAAHGRMKDRDGGDESHGKWVTFGPSDAIYPLFSFRNFTVYVPNEYAAASRTTTLALSSKCGEERCTLWASPAGGGIWRTRNALDEKPRWEYLSSVFEINSVGSIAIDPNDPDGDTIWVGTGEANACGSGCEAGVGLYKSTDGGDTWEGPIGKSIFNARAIGTIAVKPGDRHTIFAGVTRALRGVSEVCCDGAISFAPGAAKWGLYRSMDGGNSWTFVHNGSADPTLCTGDTVEAGNGTPCSPRGVRRVAFDPSDANTLYAGSYARGVWRSSDAGNSWTQIKGSLNPNATTTRPELAVNKLPNGKTRMYVAEGASGNPFARVFRSDDVTSAAPTFISLTSSNRADPGYGTFNYCEGQCWYDNFVVTPAGYPDIVYVGGSYAYNETGGVSNGRGVVLSTDAGVSFTDMTMDATDPVQPNGIHPDQHFLVTNPGNPFQFFESSDGGIIRSDGTFADISANCATRPLGPISMARCQQLLSRVPGRLTSVNKGLTTLQFWSLSVNPFDVDDLQGGTQDNGTWEITENHSKWTQTIFGDGGQSGFDVGNSHFRFHTFFSNQVDVNFTDGALIDWNWIADPFFIFPEPSQFYIPIISDPAVSQTMFAGTGHVWRTKTQGVGAQTVDAFRANCNEFTGVFAVVCGDWVPLGAADASGMLIGPGFGADRQGGNGVAAVQRTSGDTSTLWAATSTGRVFVSKNADAEPETSVTFARIDTLAANSPNRFVSGIYIDPENTNRAWISYSGYNAATPSTPGHVFRVTYDPVAGTADWKDISYDLDDLPITDVVRDDRTGTLYASSDFGVLRLDRGDKHWRLAAPGMPNVEVASLTIVPNARRLYAASHGLGAWLLRLRSNEE